MHSPRILASGSALAAIVVALSACGDVPRSDDSPESNTQRAQGVVESFVDSYNEAGLSDAVEQTFCSADAGAFAGRDSLDGGPYTTGSMTISTPAGVDGHVGEAGVQVATAQAAAQRYRVTLRKDQAQGWCITGVTPSAVGGESNARDQ